MGETLDVVKRLRRRIATGALVSACLPVGGVPFAKGAETRFSELDHWTAQRFHVIATLATEHEHMTEQLRPLDSTDIRVTIPGQFPLTPVYRPQSTIFSAPTANPWALFKTVIEADVSSAPSATSLRFFKTEAPPSERVRSATSFTSWAISISRCTQATMEIAEGIAFRYISVQPRLPQTWASSGIPALSKAFFQRTI